MKKPEILVVGSFAMDLIVRAEQEGGPLNLAPRASILAETLVLQALSVLLQERRSLTPRSMCCATPAACWASCARGWFKPC